MTHDQVCRGCDQSQKITAHSVHSRSVVNEVRWNEWYKHSLSWLIIHCSNISRWTTNGHIYKQLLLSLSQ